MVEDIATRKFLPKDNYALYLILGDSESYRVLSFSEKLLAAQASVDTDCFLCLKPNTFGDTLHHYVSASCRYNWGLDHIDMHNYIALSPSHTQNPPSIMHVILYTWK